MQNQAWDRAISEAVNAAWARLPWMVQQRLDHVRFTHNAVCGAPAAYATAGEADVDIQRLPLSTKAAIGVILHELGHIAGDHYRRLHAGEITPQEAEREADTYVKSWGLADELSEAYTFTRRG